MLAIYLALIDDPQDKELFTLLYNEHRQSMFYLANQVLRDEYLAEDAVHDAFLRIAKNIGYIDFSLSPRNLLLTIVKNVALTLKSRREREILTFDSVGIYFAESSYDLEAHYDTVSDIDVILKIVDAMPHEYGTVFRLRYTYDLTYNQISSLLDISVDSAKKRIQRIKARVNRVLSGGRANDE